MSSMDQTTEVLLLIGATATALAGVGYMLRKTWQLLSWVARLFKLLDYQLRNNGGGSMLDKVEQNTHDIAHLTGTVSEVAGTVDDLAGRFDDHLNVQAEANRAMWPAVQAVAEAQPPDERN